MNETTPMAFGTAMELFFEEFVKHFDMTDAQLVVRVMKCREAITAGNVMQSGLARNIGAHALDLLRSRLAVQS